jgi:hypothetical protein
MRRQHQVLTRSPSWPKWTKVTKTYADFSDAFLTKNVSLLSLPAGGILHSAKIKHSTAFSGGTISTYTVEVTLSGVASTYPAAFDVFQAVGASTYQLSEYFLGGSHTGTSSVVATATADQLLNTATAGSVDIWLLTSTAV